MVAAEWGTVGSAGCPGPSAAAGNGDGATPRLNSGPPARAGASGALWGSVCLTAGAVPSSICTWLKSTLSHCRALVWQAVLERQPQMPVRGFLPPAVTQEIPVSPAMHLLTTSRVGQTLWSWCQAIQNIVLVLRTMLTCAPADTGTSTQYALCLARHQQSPLLAGSSCDPARESLPAGILSGSWSPVWQLYPQEESSSTLQVSLCIVSGWSVVQYDAC